MECIKLLMMFCISFMHFNRYSADFIVVPMTLNVTAGIEAVFRCQHSVAEDLGWRVNHTSVERNPLPEVREGLDTLTILALPEYNGTVVECVALLSGGSPPAELTPPAYLFVQGSLPCVSGTNRCINESESNFLEEPSSVYVALGDEAMFRCQHITAEIIEWNINGTSIDNFHSFCNISSGSQPTADGVVHTLTIEALETYNNTNVSCVAAFNDSQYSVERTSNASLVVQGLLGAVGKLKLSVGLNNSTLTWDPPFSLDLTSVHPDVIYCVDIYNITCGNIERLVSDCNVAEPYYVYYSEDEIHKFVVIPKSNVVNSRNGTATLQSEEYRMFTSANLEQIAYKDSKSDAVQLTLKVYFSNVTIKSHLKVLQTYSIWLRAKDDEEPTLAEYTVSTVTVGNEIVLEFSDNLQYGRLWEGLLMGMNCGGIPLSERFDLSTHEVYNISVDQNSLIGQLGLSWNFINGSNALGILIVAYPLMYDSDIHYIIILRPTTHLRTLIAGASGNQYNISMFVVLENGQPFTRPMTKPLTIIITGDKGDQESFNDPSGVTLETTSEDNGVCITCFIHHNSSNGTCLIVIHPKPSSLHSRGGLSNIDVVLLNRSGSHSASGCIQGISLTNHVIAGFVYDETQVVQGPAFVIIPPNDGRMMALSGNLLWIFLTSGLFIVTMLLLVVIISIMLAVACRKKNGILGQVLMYV